LHHFKVLSERSESVSHPCKVLSERSESISHPCKVLSGLTAGADLQSVPFCRITGLNGTGCTSPHRRLTRYTKVLLEHRFLQVIHFFFSGFHILIRLYNK
jgi:hypothetical protein